MNERELMQEAFEELADDIGFCLDQKWVDFENPYENSDTYLAYSIFTKAWQASANRQGYKLVPVEPTEEMIDAGVDESDVDWKRLKFAYQAMIGAVE